jgi:hypothetical protein
MKPKRIWWIAATVLGLLAVNEYRSQRSQAEAMRSELASLRAQQDRLATQVARPAVVVRAQAGAFDARSPTAPSPATQASPASSASGDDHAGDANALDTRWEDVARTSRASVEDAFAAESASSAWAPPTRVVLEDRLASLARLTASSLRDIDCRTSMCRVEVAHHDADASRQFAERAFTDPQTPAWDGPVFIPPAQPDADGGVVAVMYLGRRGNQLIKPE